MFDSLQPHGLWPARILGPWDFPGKNTGVDFHFHPIRQLLLLSHFSRVRQQSPTFLAPGTSFVEDSFSTDWGRFGDDSGTRHLLRTSPVAILLRTHLPMQETWETWVPPLNWKYPLEESMATLSSILAWRNPIDRGAWQVPVHRVTKSQTQLM